MEPVDAVAFGAASLRKKAEENHDFRYDLLLRVGRVMLEHLRLVFATHEVLVRGNALRRIETTMQRMELSFLAALPSSQRSLVPDGQPVIVEIIVTETKDAERRNTSSEE